MPKKKKFAGKKTKLAEHALTHVLEQERSEDADARQTLEAPPPSLTLAQAVQALRNDQLRLGLSVPEGEPPASSGQLETANAFMSVVQELEEMREQLRAPHLPARPRSVGQKTKSLPQIEIIKYFLQVIGNTLQELKASLN